MDLLFTATLLAALGCGLMAGVFFAFSNFVMQGLGRLPAHEGIAAMQAINVTVLNPLFLGVFLGTAVVSVGLGVAAVLDWGTPGSAHLLLGAVLYVVGTFAETRIVHIPRNDALARVEASDPSAVLVWDAYLKEWTAWNHVRTIAALLAAAAFTFALVP